MRFLQMTSVYGLISSPLSQKTLEMPPPFAVGDRSARVRRFEEKDVAEGMRLMNDVIVEGKAWPFEEEFDREGYCSYFLSHDAFVVEIEDKVVGTFYIKPNFPGRCSHVCNGGFIVSREERGKGLGTIMGHSFLKFAKDLGYTASYFNLVFASNTASVRLWEKLDFSRVATIPNCARLKGLEGLDTAYGYHFDLTKDFLPS